MQNKTNAMNSKIELQNLSAIDIKNKIENAISHDPKKYKDNKILFENKENDFIKLPFSDFKISIAQELEEDKLLINEINQYDLIEENIVDKTEFIPEPTQEQEENEVNVIDEIYEYEEDCKKPKLKSKAKIVKADTDAVIAKIKAEAREKNKGKKVTTRRDINKELRPYMIKKMHGVKLNKDALTSIDIYLNAVNKIDVVSTPDEIKDPIASSEPNLDEIINDILNDSDK